MKPNLVYTLQSDYKDGFDSSFEYKTEPFITVSTNDLLLIKPLICAEVSFNQPTKCTMKETEL